MCIGDGNGKPMKWKSGAGAQRRPQPTSAIGRSGWSSFDNPGCEQRGNPGERLGAGPTDMLPRNRAANYIRIQFASPSCWKIKLS